MNVENKAAQPGVPDARGGVAGWKVPVLERSALKETHNTESALAAESQQVAFLTDCNLLKRQALAPFLVQSENSCQASKSSYIF